MLVEHKTGDQNTVNIETKWPKQDHTIPVCKEQRRVTPSIVPVVAYCYVFLNQD